MKYINKLISSKLAKNGFWMILLQGFNTVVPLITLPYITRILSTRAYGEFSLALNWIGYFQVFVEYGFGLTGARKVAMRQNDEDLSIIRSSIIYARLLLMMVSLLIFGGITIFIRLDSIQLVCCLILFIMVFAVIFQQTWFFQGIGEMKNITIINVISRSFSVALIFMLVKKADDLFLYCFLYVSNYILSSAIGCIIVRRKYGIRIISPQKCNLMQELKEGWALFVSSAMSKIFGSVGITVLGFYATKDIVGIYSAINKIPYILTILFAALSQVLYPHFCKCFLDGFSSGCKAVRKYSIPIIGVFVLIGASLILGNKIIVQIAFGYEYIQYSTLLVPFVIWVIFGILNNFLGIQTLVASGHQKQYSTAFSISMILAALLFFVLGKYIGVYGIASASMISEVVLTIMLVLAIKMIKKKEQK